MILSKKKENFQERWLRRGQKNPLPVMFSPNSIFFLLQCLIIKILYLLSVRFDSWFISYKQKLDIERQIRKFWEKLVAKGSKNPLSDMFFPNLIFFPASVLIEKNFKPFFSPIWQLVLQLQAKTWYWATDKKILRKNGYAGVKKTFPAD